MKMEDWKKTFISPEATVKESVQKINTAGKQIALVVDNETNQLIGTVTDGDIRRAILRDIPFESPVTVVMNSNPKVAKWNMTDEELHEYIMQLGIRHLPIVNEVGEIVGLKILDEFYEKEANQHNVLILAGGLGSRLGELTKNCPKPMMKIDEMPLLEINIRRLKGQGFRNFFISVNYLSDVIEEHFGDGSLLGVKINYLKESERLGTAGPISLLPNISEEPFLVLNGDLLTNLNFSDLMYFHKANSHDMTICVRKHEYVIPYGVLDLEGSSVLKIQEKPSYTKFINAGIYIMNHNVLDLISKNEYFGMNDLLNKAVNNGLNVECYSIKEYWRDIGTPDDLELARSEYSKLK